MDGQRSNFIKRNGGNTLSTISVVVAVYNVEEYIKRCVSSIQNQTYKKLEIILVDDGSTDNCPDILDEMQRNDDRIKVIHKINGGLSDARNAGTGIATGDYIAYVDGDDWIDPQMYEVMLSQIEQYQADCVVCGYKQIYQDHTICVQDDMVKVFEKGEALKAFIEEDEHYQIQNAAWNKLYKRNITQKLRFPKGRWYEDIVYTTKLFAMVNRCVYINKAFYNYVINREGSIMNVGLNDRIFSDQIPAYQEKRDFLISIGRMDLAFIHDYFFNKRLLQYDNSIAFSQTTQNKKYKKKIRELILSSRDNIEAIYDNSIASSNDKMKIRLYIKTPVLYRILMYVNNKLIIPYKQKRNRKKGGKQ